MGHGIRKITAPITGTISGWAEDNETDKQALARLILEAEMKANEEGNPRLHLNLKENEQ
jgi:hypothetical protein